MHACLRSLIEPLEARIAPAFAPVIELSNLDGLNGFKINGVAVDDLSGYSVSDAGDVNGDGFDDLLVGARAADANGSNSGASYVIFGKAGGFAANLNLSTLNGSNGFKISGESAYDFAGTSVSAAGDVNGDGFGDLIIGADGADPNGSRSGASYVVFGRGTPFGANVNLATLSPLSGFKLSGGAADDRSGRRVSGAGDVNGDGFDDLIIGAPGADSNATDSGAGYVVFGKATGFTQNLNLSTLNGINGFKISGVAVDDNSGRSVSAAGDVNGDGYDDVIIGAPYADPRGSYSGASYVVFGKASGFAPNLNLASLDGRNGFKLSGVEPGDYCSRSVSGAGDINNDGFADLIIGAATANSNGASYIFFGKASGFLADTNLSMLDGINGFKITGTAPADFAGIAVSGAGDVNGDGFDDVIIGAQGADSNGTDSGASFVVFGKAAGFPPDLNLSTLNGSNGFRLNGVAFNDIAGASVSAAGDVNGDGFDDLIVGAYYADPNGNRSGASYVIFGAGLPALSVNDAVVAEGNVGVANLTFTATLSGVSAEPVTVRYTVQDGTAQAGSDFIGVVNELLSFAPGERSKTIAISVTADRVHELDETLTLLLSESTNATILKSSATGTIGNDDPAPVMNIADVAVLESNAGSSDFTFVVSLSEPSGLPAVVNVTSVDGSALGGSDYTPLAVSTLTFAPGETSKPITIEVIGDLEIERHESFSVVLSGINGATIGRGTATGTILNDDTALSMSDAVEIEGDSGFKEFAFGVSLEQPSALPVTVTYSTVGEAASAGSDFESIADTQLTFAPGETSKTAIVKVKGDVSIEDHESFSVVLSDAINASLEIGTATGTILNDDTAIRISDVNVREGDENTTPLGFTVTLEKPSALPVAVNYSTLEGSANVGSDFAAIVDSQLTFAPGETEKTITVDVIGDKIVEAFETFSVVLSEPFNASVVNGTATGTILNDDTLLRINDASALEGHAGIHALTFTITLSAPTALPVSVDFASADGTATAGADYTALTPGTLHFAPGETSKTIAVDVLGDTVVEPSKTLSIVLSQASNAVIDQATAVGTILDDDVTLHGKRSATFNDVDGDLVTIKVNKGTLKVEDFTIVPSGSGAQLALVDFSGQIELAGANLSVTAKRAAGTPGGVRLVDVGAINASGIDLGKVMIKGDLGEINAGNDLDPRPGLLGLSARSLGQRGIETQLPSGSLQSEIAGAFKTLKLADGMQDATLSVSGDMGTLAIKGSVLGSAIRTDGKVGAIKISGDLAASATSTATISARGTLAPASNAKAIAIGILSVGGSVDHAEILAGYDRSRAAVNGDAAIGLVRVGGNWTASDLAAGVSPGTDRMFGTDDDLLILGGNQIIAKIASITIKGTVNGTDDGTDRFGFVAQQIGAFSSSGLKLALTAGPSNDLAGLPAGVTGQVKVREAA
jgi:hypothetical protein